MVNFFINRPIAVSMVLLSLLVLGWISATELPVSLMPNIAIPEVTIQASYPDASTQQMENTITKILRQQLLQVPHLADIKSESKKGHATIRLQLDYGTNVNYSFIEINEKVDAALHALPRDIERPKIIKASAVDIPVFKLLLTVRTDSLMSRAKGQGGIDEVETSFQFLELSEFAENVIKRRLEQLPEIALVDVSGLSHSELQIVPDTVKMKSLGLKLSDLENMLLENNRSIGNIKVKDGQYQYDVSIGSELSSLDEIANLSFLANNRLLQLKDIAAVNLAITKETGLCTLDNNRAIILSIIKQSDAQLADLKSSVDLLMTHFNREYPSILFSISQDQSELLEYAILNLEQSLAIGGAMAFFVMFFFLRDIRAPWLIGISVPASLIICLLLFKLIGLSINIISLSGLILGIGLMIDNAIIVIDNISRHYYDKKLNVACVTGTNEVIRPLLSSALTTCAVFIPLIFISGISGAIFYDQAIAVSIGLGVSLVVSVTALPVYFKLLYSRERFIKLNSILKNVNLLPYEKIYSWGYALVFKNQPLMLVVFLLFMLGSIYFYLKLEIRRLPETTQTELILNLNWNDDIHVYENWRRIRSLLHAVKEPIVQENSEIGEQQFLLEESESLEVSSAVVYLKAENPQDLDKIRLALNNYLLQNYPRASWSIERPTNIFERLFKEKEAPLIAQIRIKDQNPSGKISKLNVMNSELKKRFENIRLPDLPLEREINLLLDREKMLLYKVSASDVIEKLRTAFQENQISYLKSFQRFIPIKLSFRQKGLPQILSETFVHNLDDKEIPLNTFVSISINENLKKVTAGKDGEYYPIRIDANINNYKFRQDSIRRVLMGFDWVSVDFSGSIFKNKKLIRELCLVMSVALLLLYFILAAQFESLKQPLIVLTEIPINITGALGLLYISNSSINIMSMIGIVVMSGIIINDSILKIDTINQLRKSGVGLDRAIILAGQRRLKPILMTSLTTILALIPLLWSDKFGAELQTPLALTVIGGLGLGTFVSLYYLPLFYRWLYKREASDHID